MVLVINSKFIVVSTVTHLLDTDKRFLTDINNFAVGQTLIASG